MSGGQRITITQGSPAVGENAEAGDRFGATVATGYLDGDGCADLIVSAPGEDVAGTVNAGAAWVIFGSPTGLGQGRPGLTLNQGSGIVPGVRNTGDAFGSTLATSTRLPGVLAIGAPVDNLGTVINAGTVTVVQFDGDGVPSSARLISQDLTGISDTAESNDRLGAAMVLMDSCLVVGVPGEDVGSAADAGVVQTICNVDTAGPYPNDLVGQNSSGVGGTAESGDGFGSSLSLDPGLLELRPLAVGVPKEDIGSKTDAGVVNWLVRKNNVWTGATVISQDSTGVADSAESGDQFGTRLQTAIMHGQLKLIVGTPYENVGSTIDAGQVQVLSSLLQTEFTLTQSSSGFAGVPERGDHFGAALGITGMQVLLVGAPDDDDYPRGIVHGLDWSRLTIGSGASYTLTPGSNGARFGASLASA